jgi:ABC-type antimicrobial peptide transport system permease subunit
MEPFPTFMRIYQHEEAMKAYLTNLPMSTWLLLAVPVVVIASPVVGNVVTAVVRAVVPEVVRTVLSMI